MLRQSQYTDQQTCIRISNCGLVSSQGLKKKSGDQYNLHFDTQGMREMGKRFAHTFLSLTDQEYIPRIGL
jgi:hypothetical protein